MTLLRSAVLPRSRQPLSLRSRSCQISGTVPRANAAFPHAASVLVRVAPPNASMVDSSSGAALDPLSRLFRRGVRNAWMMCDIPASTWAPASIGVRSPRRSMRAGAGSNRILSLASSATLGVSRRARRRIVTRRRVPLLGQPGVDHGHQGPVSRYMHGLARRDRLAGGPFPTVELDRRIPAARSMRLRHPRPYPGAVTRRNARASGTPKTPRAAKAGRNSPPPTAGSGCTGVRASWTSGTLLPTNRERRCAAPRPARSADR